MATKAGKVQTAVKPRGRAAEKTAGDQPKKVGRPAVGKRTDPDYQQVSGWVRRTTYADVSIGLIEESKGKPKKREFSELLQELLERWLLERSQASKKRSA